MSIAEPFKGISFPWGGGGNHILHLMSLDKSFDLYYRKWGVDNPTIDNKLEFIKENVYPESRTWNNWLEFEWRYRKDHDKVVKIFHEFSEWTTKDANGKKYNIPNGSRILFLENHDPTLLLNHYRHINLGMNNTSPEVYIKRCKVWQQKLTCVKKINLKGCLVLDGSIIHQPNLDLNFYNQVCDFFYFNKFFSEAKQIHSWWVKSRIRSAKDFYKYFHDDEFQTYLKTMKDFAKNWEELL